MAIEPATTKSVFESKTMWFNVIMGAAELAKEALGMGLIPAPWNMVVTIVGNVILRMLTTEGVTWPTSAPQ